jgi:nucleoside-diphosphate-sugar epimerase
VEAFSFSGLEPDTDWAAFVGGVEVIIHAAARVHVLQDLSERAEEEYFRTNVSATLNLAEQAALAGVKRFIFISSIKVNGEYTSIGSPFTPDQRVNPTDLYGISKYRAEQGLRAIAARTGLEVVIIRPVLVYGPGVKANFLNMMRWVDKGIPLPLGFVRNQRSMVALGNLVDLIITCIGHPAAGDQTFLVSDSNDLSTTDLLRKVSKSFNKPVRLLPVPPWMLKCVAAALGKGDISQRLCASLQVDISKTIRVLDWRPPVDIDLALAETVRHYMEHKADV